MFVFRMFPADCKSAEAGTNLPERVFTLCRRAVIEAT